MAANENPPGSVLDEACTQLNEGLKSCRSVVENYRLMLSDAAAAEAANVPEEPTVRRSADG